MEKYLSTCLTLISLFSTAGVSIPEDSDRWCEVVHLVLDKMNPPPRLRGLVEVRLTNIYDIADGIFFDVRYKTSDKWDRSMVFNPDTRDAWVAITNIKQQTTTNRILNEWAR